MSNVRSLSGVPTLSDFKGTSGPPLILNILTGDIYFLDKDNVTIRKSGGATAASISFPPSGNLAATNVEAALIELDTEKQPLLISGSTIKTFNGNSMLGSGDLTDRPFAVAMAVALG